MSEFQPLSTMAELDALDSDECLAGYRSGWSGDPEPGSDKSKSHWHGWRNGMMDSGRMALDTASHSLVREVVGTYRGLH
jgi:hypothetical protein